MSESEKEKNQEEDRSIFARRGSASDAEPLSFRELSSSSEPEPNKEDPKDE